MSTPNPQALPTAAAAAGDPATNSAIPSPPDRHAAPDMPSAVFALFRQDAAAADDDSAPSSRTATLELAWKEYDACRARGEQLDAEAFCQRFPQYKSSVLKSLEAHSFLLANPHLVGDASAIPWPEVGHSFCGFVLRRQLGKGAFARVFLATETALGDRLVVVKVAVFSGSEAPILGQLDHANIVPVHSVRRHPLTGLSVICMPYLGTSTLREVIDRAFAGPDAPPARARVILEAARADNLPPAKTPAVLRTGSYVDGVLHLGVQLAEALVFIGDRDVYHRDLKPSNVLVCPDGTPMLLDFNLAQGGKNPMDFVGGTPAYMSPEQLRATDPDGGPGPELLDESSDLFSLGVILYELLAGTHPYCPSYQPKQDEELRKLLLDRQRHGATPLHKQNPAVDASLSRLIDSCLAYRPQDRPGSAELAAGLRKALSSPRRVRRWATRRPLVTAAVLLLVCALSATTVGAGFWYVQTAGERTQHQGRESYRNGAYREAVDCFSRVLQDDPTNAPVRFARGRALQRLGEQGDPSCFTLAVADFHAAEDRAPSGRGFASAAYCLTSRNLHLDAILEYQRSLRAGYANAELWNNLGYAFLKTGKWLEAHAALDRAIEINPGLQAAYHNRALVYFQKAHFRQAQADPLAAAEYAKKAVSDVEAALDSGAPSAELYYDAACLNLLWASLGEPTRRQRALDHLSHAVDFGFDPALLKDNLAMNPLRSHARFQSLSAKRSPEHPPLPNRRYLDPVRE